MWFIRGMTSPEVTTPTGSNFQMMQWQWYLFLHELCDVLIYCFMWYKNSINSQWDEWMNEWMVFWARMLNCKAMLGRGLDLMRWVLVWMIPQVKDWLHDLLTCSPARYNFATAAFLSNSQWDIWIIWTHCGIISLCYHFRRNTKRVADWLRHWLCYQGVFSWVSFFAGSVMNRGVGNVLNPHINSGHQAVFFTLWNGCMSYMYGLTVYNPLQSISVGLYLDCRIIAF